jgi:hypothetical protein
MGHMNKDMMQATKDMLAAKGLDDEKGWALAVSMAKDQLHEYEQMALACDDEKERIGLIHEARGAKNFLASLLNALEETKSGVTKSGVRKEQEN